MARVWLQQARYNTITNRPSPRVRLLLERLNDLGQPYQCDNNGEPSDAGTFLGHDDHRLTREDEIMFWVLRNATGAQLTTLANRITTALQADPEADVRETIRVELKAAIDARRAQLQGM